MTEFAYTGGRVIFSGDVSQASGGVSGGQAAGGTISDGGLDTVFEIGDTLQFVTLGSNESATLVGTINVDGNILPVITTVSIGTGETFSSVLYQSGFDPNDIPNPLGPTDVDDATSFTTCFHEDTLIAVETGETKVSDLAIGDRVRVANGQLEPVRWIGRQTVSTRFGAAERLTPVRFSAGSLGQGCPHSDLIVTADHAMLVGGVLCNAGALVNGTTIVRVPLSEFEDTYTVYHIETDRHEIILANGAPAETFIDNVSRRVFDNFAEFEALYGDVPEMEELPLPRAMSTRQVPFATRCALAQRQTA